VHIASLLRVFLITSKHIGVSIAFKEFIRRDFGINYTYRNISANSSAIFRLIRNVLLKVITENLATYSRSKIFEGWIRSLELWNLRNFLATDPSPR
jgi:hypothetical protein